MALIIIQTPVQFPTDCPPSVTNNREAPTPIFHTDDWASYAQSPTENQLAVVDRQGNLKIWDIETQQYSRTILTDSRITQSPRWSPNGEQIAKPIGKQVFLLDAQTGDVIHILDGHPISPLNDVPLERFTDVTGYAFSPDGLHFATSHSYDEAAIIWSLETGEIDHILDHHEGGVQDVQFTPDSEYLIAVTRHAKTIKVWRSATGERAYEFPSHIRGVVALSPDSRLLAIGYTGTAGKRESFIDVWDLQTGDRLHRFNAPLDVDNRWTFTADSHGLFATFSYIIRGMTDSQPIPTAIRGWNIDTGQQIFVTQFNDGLPHSFLLNQDASLIFIEQYNFEQLNGEVVIWDVENNCAILTINFDAEPFLSLRWLTEQYFLTSSGNLDSRRTIIWRIN
jgi:WD40 repeat protein